MDKLSIVADCIRSVELSEPWTDRYPKLCIDADLEGQFLMISKNWIKVRMLFLSRINWELREEVVRISFQDNGVFIIDNFSKLSKACRNYVKSFCEKVQIKVKLYQKG
jgi:hypothetical protein